MPQEDAQHTACLHERSTTTKTKERTTVVRHPQALETWPFVAVHQWTCTVYIHMTGKTKLAANYALDSISFLECSDPARGFLVDDRTHGTPTFYSYFCRELARRGRARMQDARERLLARAAGKGESGLIVTRAMVRQEMSRRAVEIMHGKVRDPSPTATIYTFAAKPNVYLISFLFLQVG